jgi:hypothetical protein
MKKYNKGKYYITKSSSCGTLEKGYQIYIDENRLNFLYPCCGFIKNGYWEHLDFKAVPMFDELFERRK